MNKQQIAVALELVSQGLEIRYAGRAMMSVAPNCYMFLEKKEDGNVVQIQSRNPLEIIALLVDDTENQKSESSKVRMIYDSYPRKVAVGYARNAIARALKDTEIPVAANMRFLYLLTATRLIAKYHQDKKTPKEKIPYPATWFNGKSYLNSPEVVKKWIPSVAATLNANVSDVAKGLQMDFGSFASDTTQ